MLEPNQTYHTVLETLHIEEYLVDGSYPSLPSITHKVSKNACCEDTEVI